MLRLRWTVLLCATVAVLLSGVACRTRRPAAPHATPDPRHSFHTTPDKWEKPRRYHEPFSETCEDRMILSHGEPATPPSLKLMSPNDAYWVGADPSSSPRDPDSDPRRVHFWVESPDFPIYIFNERPKCLVLTVKDHCPNYSVELRWINEKLLYMEVPWGRVAGSYVILDVENETVVYREMVRDGTLPYLQWQQVKAQ